MTGLHGVCMNIFMITYEIQCNMKIMGDFIGNTGKNDLCKRFYIG